MHNPNSLAFLPKLIILGQGTNISRSVVYIQAPQKHLRAGYARDLL